MKKIKTLCAVCAMAMCFSTLSVTASAEETSGGAALTREQCNKIVETAIEEYHIVIPDTEEYKAYIWDMAKESGLTANAVETQFKADFGKATERKKLNEKRAADVYINSAEEAMAALDEINAEKHTAYNLGVGPFAEKADYLDALQLDKEAFKERVEHEMKNNQGGELVEKLGIEDFNEKLPGVSLRSIREDVQQESNGILTNLNTSDNTIVKGYLNARVFSVTGDPGSFTYERIKSYGVSNYGSAKNGSCSLSGSSGSHTAVIHASGYIGYISVTGQIPFSAG